MDTLSKKAYLQDPCGTSSLPYWKAKAVAVPEGMMILHHDANSTWDHRAYTDEPYFRLRHDLQGLFAPVLPQGFSLCRAALGDYAAHIESCYNGAENIAQELKAYVTRPVYDAALWLAVRDETTGRIAATGIAELDREIGEGVLEWIQVSKENRGRGLGRYIVSELLWRMKDRAQFATVSGQCANPTDPESLYRRCGFTGSDVWHILRRRE